MWGPLGTFSPDCLESPTPGPYTLEGSFLSSVVLCRPDMELGGRLKHLRVILLEVSLLSTVIASPSLFTWVPLGSFSGKFKADLKVIVQASVFPSLFMTLLLLLPAIIDCLSHL